MNRRATPRRAGRGTNQYATKPGWNTDQFSGTANRRRLAELAQSADEDDVAFALNPDAAEWQAIGVRTHAEMSEWEAAGFPTPASVRPWRAKRFRPDRARLWATNGFSADEAHGWGEREVPLITAVAYRRVGIKPSHSMLSLRADWTPETEAMVWERSGVGIDDIVKWKNEGLGTTEAKEWSSLLSDPGQVRWWIEQRYSAERAGRWIAAGVDPVTAREWDHGPWVDPQWAVDMEAAGVKAAFAFGMRRLGRNDPDLTVRWSTAGFTDANDAIVWIRGGYNPNRAFTFHQAGYASPKDVPAELRRSKKTTVDSVEVSG